MYNFYYLFFWLFLIPGSAWRLMRIQHPDPHSNAPCGSTSLVLLHETADRHVGKRQIESP